MLPDRPEFEPWLSGREVVLLALGLSRMEVSESTVDERLKATGLVEAADRRVGGYSRGMSQRLGLAACLACQPQLMILDEPCTALDPAVVAILPPHPAPLSARRIADDHRRVRAGSRVCGRQDRIGSPGGDRPARGRRTGRAVPIAGVLGALRDVGGAARRSRDRDYRWCDHACVGAVAGTSRSVADAVALLPQAPPIVGRVARRLPEIALASPSAVTGSYSRHDMGVRLYRRVIEIRDGALLLRGYRDPTVTTAAESAAQHAGLRGERLRATVEAAELAAAIEAKRRNRRASSTAGPPPATLEPDVRSEARWLAQVAAAFSRSPIVAEQARRAAHPISEAARKH